MLEAIYRKPRISQPAAGAQTYPYLLRDREVLTPDEVWCADKTYIPMARGFAYLVAVMDWKTRAVLSWKLSISDTAPPQLPCHRPAAAPWTLRHCLPNPHWLQAACRMLAAVAKLLTNLIQKRSPPLFPRPKYLCRIRGNSSSLTF
jgi:transposase InsO family protein